MSDRGPDVAALAVLADLVITVCLAAFLTAATKPEGDAVPRPLLIAMLYATPGIVGWLGRRARSRSLLIAPCLSLVPGAFLSFAGVTLPFMVPALLFLAAATTTAGRASIRDLIVGVASVIVLTSLMVGAAIASLIALTGASCFTTATETGCGTGQLTFIGFGVALGSDALAIALASVVIRRRTGWGSPSRPYTPDHARPAEPTRPGE